MPKKKNSEKEETPKKKKDSLLSQSLTLVEHFISYFELLFIYYQKIIQNKIQNGFIITVAILYAVFLKVLGTVFLAIAGYLYLLKQFNDPILSALCLGVFILVVSFILLLYSIKKIT